MHADPFICCHWVRCVCKIQFISILDTSVDHNFWADVGKQQFNYVLQFFLPFRYSLLSRAHPCFFSQAKVSAGNGCLTWEALICSENGNRCAGDAVAQMMAGMMTTSLSSMIAQMDRYSSDVICRKGNVQGVWWECSIWVKWLQNDGRKVIVWGILINIHQIRQQPELGLSSVLF